MLCLAPCGRAIDLQGTDDEDPEAEAELWRLQIACMKPVDHGYHIANLKSCGTKMPSMKTDLGTHPQRACCPVYPAAINATPIVWNDHTTSVSVTAAYDLFGMDCDFVVEEEWLTLDLVLSTGTPPLFSGQCCLHFQRNRFPRSLALPILTWQFLFPTCVNFCWPSRWSCYLTAQSRRHNI